MSFLNLYHVNQNKKCYFQLYWYMLMFLSNILYFHINNVLIFHLCFTKKSKDMSFPNPAWIRKYSH